MFGAQALLKELPGKLGAQTRVVRAPCMGGCHNAPVAAIGHALHEHASLDSVVKLIKERAGGPSKPKARPSKPTRQAIPASTPIASAGGYKLLESCLAGEKTLEQILKTLEDSQSARPGRRRISHRPQMAPGGAPRRRRG